MKLPRSLSGHDLVKLLRRYGYEIARQSGSHLRAASKIRGTEHHITIPAHKALKVGTLSSILSEMAAYLEMTRSQLEQELFGQ